MTNSCEYCDIDCNECYYNNRTNSLECLIEYCEEDYYYYDYDTTYDDVTGTYTYTYDYDNVTYTYDDGTGTSDSSYYYDYYYYDYYYYGGAAMDLAWSVIVFGIVLPIAVCIGITILIICCSTGRCGRKRGHTFHRPPPVVHGESSNPPPQMYDPSMYNPDMNPNMNPNMYQPGMAPPPGMMYPPPQGMMYP
mmetsp:Transcript_9388/g.8873  ORF Transcript_9388/g.8873 Transcript_9388/m.8873 type:complete len:192 (+) Transcript_9388:2761-3336(+)